MFKTNIMLKRFCFALIMISFLFVSCNNNPLKVDVSGVEIDFNLIRFDQEMSEIDTSDIWTPTLRLSEQYPEFWYLYTYQIINIGGIQNKMFERDFREYYADYFIKDTYTKVAEIFPDLKDFEAGLVEGFKHYAYYFPEKLIPDVYTYVGGYNQSIVAADEFMGLALEKYQGSNSDFYFQLNVPSFVKYTMQPEFMVADCMRAWGQTEFVISDSINSLVANMIYEGKIIYFANAMLPEASDSILMHYTGKQIEWCEKFEKRMWNYMITQKILFKDEQDYIRRYISNGPYTASFDKASPGRTGIWIGWQIVKAYMKQNPDVSLPQLMAENDYHKILNMSKYNP